MQILSLIFLATISSAQATSSEKLLSFVEQPAQDGKLYVAETESYRTKNPCTWAASQNFSLAWNACDAAKYSSCEHVSTKVLEKHDGYCRVRNIVRGTKK